MAQPPLYRAKRGESLRYLKDDREMENYLIDTGLKDAALVDQAEGPIAGEDLRHRVERAVRARQFMSPLVRTAGNADVVAPAPVAGALPTPLLADYPQSSPAAQGTGRAACRESGGK